MCTHIADLHKNFARQYSEHCRVVDEARSVRITLEGLVSHINRITTINSFCVKTTCC